MSKCKAVPQPNRFSVDSNRGQAAVAVVLLSTDALFSLSGHVHCYDLLILHLSWSNSSVPVTMYISF